MSIASDADISDISLVESYELTFKIGDSYELGIHGGGNGVGNEVTVRQTSGEVRIKIKSPDSHQGACTVIRIRPAADEREEKPKKMEMDNPGEDTV